MTIDRPRRLDHVYSWNQTPFKTPFPGCRLREKGKKEGRRQGRPEEEDRKGEWREKEVGRRKR